MSDFLTDWIGIGRHTGWMSMEAGIDGMMLA
jgi:hypothetical protein